MSGGGDARVVAGAAVEMHVVEAQADLSLSLSLSISLLWCDALECSWGEKENKKKGGCVSCVEEKNKKKKKEKKKWNVDENEMEGRKII